MPPKEQAQYIPQEKPRRKQKRSEKTLTAQKNLNRVERLRRKMLQHQAKDSRAQKKGKGKAKDKGQERLHHDWSESLLRWDIHDHDDDNKGQTEECAEARGTSRASTSRCERLVA